MVKNQRTSSSASKTFLERLGRAWLIVRIARDSGVKFQAAVGLQNRTVVAKDPSVGALSSPLAGQATFHWSRVVDLYSVPVRGQADGNETGKRGDGQICGDGPRGAA